MARRELASEIFEEERLAVQKLMDGTTSDIIRASEHLYHGTEGFPRDKVVAKKILYHAAENGAAEAQYALAIGLLGRRFNIQSFARSSQLMQVETYLMQAVAQRYVPAILKLAQICERIQNDLNDLSAYALYKMAASEGETGLGEHLQRLRERIPVYLVDNDLEPLESRIREGKGPLCY